MTVLRRLLTARPGLIRLIQVGFAVALAFGILDITPEQIAVVIAAVEAAFAYVAQLSGLQTRDQFNKEMGDLADGNAS